MSIRIWYWGRFMKSEGSIMYDGGFSRTFAVGFDYFSMNYLMNLTIRCNGDREIE